MRRLIDLIQMELEIAEAVWSRRIRSFVLALAAFAAPPVVILVIARTLEKMPMPGLAQSSGPTLSILGLVLVAKLLGAAIQTYLKDRAVLLRF